MYRISPFSQYLMQYLQKEANQAEMAVTSDIFLLFSLVYFHWPSLSIIVALLKFGARYSIKYVICI
jgi:hypothetical protein